jgi:hypothetical protein
MANIEDSCDKKDIALITVLVQVFLVSLLVEQFVERYLEERSTLVCLADEVS